MQEDLLAGLDRPVTVLAAFPHPDDESFAAGGVLALYARDPDIRTVTLCMTKGGKSGALALAGLSNDTEREQRTIEYAAATKILGVDRALIWDYMDQELDRVPEDELVGRLAESMRSEAADVVVTYGPDGITGHPDHVMGHEAVTAAARVAGVKRLYYVSAPRWLARHALKVEVMPPTHAVDVREVYKAKILALKSHASQMLISREPMIWVGGIMRLYGKEFFHRAI